MSKTLHLIDHPFTPNLPPRRASEEKAALLSESYLGLDDEVLFAIQQVTSPDRCPKVWALAGDAYEDATFTPGEASQLAAECQELVPDAEPTAAIWLSTIAALASAAGAVGKHLAAEAD